MKKILVVGGAGYVGGVVVDLLLKSKNYEITVYDNLLYEESFRKNCKFIYGDVRDKIFFKKNCNNYNYIIWLAALVGDGACNINPKVTNDINYKSLIVIKNLFKGKLIFFSTCSVYGCQNTLLDEESKTDPLSIYASSKLLVEKLFVNKNVIIFRLGTLFGLSDLFSRIRMDLVVNTLCAKAFFEKKITVFGGDQFRPLLHVKDVARATSLALKSKKKGIYNLAYKNMRIIDIAKLIKKTFRKTKIISTNIKFQDARNYRVLTSKAEKELGFKPVYDVSYGIKELKSLLQERRIKNFNDPRYTNQKFLEVFKKV
jgi:nucleoside-diphosphate-sugar epimerase